MVYIFIAFFAINNIASTLTNTRAMVASLSLLRALSLVTLSLLAIQASASSPSWSGIPIEQFAQSKVDRNRVWAIGNHTLFKSEDGGKSWKPMHVPYSYDVSWVGIDQLDPRKVYVLGKRATVRLDATFFVSTDEGITWTMQGATESELAKRESNTTGLSKVYTPPESAVASRLSSLTLTGSLNFPNYGAVQALADTLYALNGSTLWVKEPGEEWKVRHSFPTAFGKHPSNFLSLNHNTLVLRLWDGNWLQSGDKGHSWKPASNGFQALNRIAPSAEGRNEPSPNRVNQCEVHVSAASGRVLVATCLWMGPFRPGNTCLHYSKDGGRSWKPTRVIEPREGSSCSRAGLPSAWQPQAMLIDVNNPNKMLISWAFGGVFRTEDGGQRWTPSGEGLTFDERSGRYDPFIFSKPPVVRAVIRRDLVYLDQLLAQGESINEIGNDNIGVLVAEMSATGPETWLKPVPPLWTELRKRGANVNQPEERYSGLMDSALRQNNQEIINDLIAAGYDWGRPRFAGIDSRDFSTEIVNLARDPSPKSKQLLDHIIEAYLQAGKLPSADMTVRDLLASKETSKAMAILNAATLTSPFDQQPTPQRASKIQLTELLLGAKEFDWARRVFALSTEEERQKHTVSYTSFVAALAATCNPTEVAWYVARGAMQPRFSACATKN